MRRALVFVWLACLLPIVARAQTLRDWTVLETEHFRFQFPPSPAVRPAEFAARQERAFDDLRMFFPGNLPGRIEFFVWNSNLDGERLLGRALGFSRPDLLLIHATFDQTPGHELTHVLAYYTVHPERAGRFFQEGTAVAFDLSGRDRMGTARAALQRSNAGYRSVIDVLQREAEAAQDVLYPLAGAFVEHLVARGGRDRFLQFLRNQTAANARSVYGSDWDAIVGTFDRELFQANASAATAAQGSPDAANTPLETLRARAQDRMRLDAKSYSPQQQREIEELYQSANRDLRAPGAKDTLEQLVQKYPKSNRAGCATLYLAQLSTGVERETYLKLAIDAHGDAWFGDGAQVGAFARTQLAAFYLQAGREAEAEKLAQDVLANYPGAVDHGGGRLADGLRRLKLVP